MDLTHFVLNSLKSAIQGLAGSLVLILPAFHATLPLSKLFLKSLEEIRRLQYRTTLLRRLLQPLLPKKERRRNENRSDKDG